MMSVEVERKFLWNADTLKTLEKIGGVAVTQCQFHDKYFDNPQFDLTLADTWLREREGRWELKCPTLFERTAKTNVAGELCTRYKEITNLSEIHLKVKEVIKDYEDGERGPSLQEEDAWLQRFQLVCFAEFTTIRRSFVLEEEGVRVDLDQADFGYSVGEIEVLVPEGGDVKSALGRIERIAQKLGLTGNQRIRGKMHVFLERNLPDHYAKLLREHVL
ncbi:thiamine-triphosphatase isoform X2 [Takifugu flavidus]|uniref:thiamine-triphosphatase isoform X2 n=1 Tax=Takifugu flavidus TaxID=433684 RepID=UPI0025443709|nr:thiamine-triphosphatase isoform X2 [Takifugu flavidus]